MLMTFVEESIPAKLIYIKEAENENKDASVASPELIKALKFAAESISAAKRKDGTPPQVIKNELKLQEPFNEYEFIIDDLHD